MQEIKGQRILVANRGISARRICRAIRERFGAIAVMTTTDIDRTSPCVSAAQELMQLGADPRAYLDIERILHLAKQQGIIAIHPGWGFASEDDRFPMLCEAAGIVFIGSSTESMRLLGNKVQVRNLAKRLDIPVVPGSEDSVDIPTARKEAAAIGFPIMLKAEGGGGGRGIFEVHNDADLEDAFTKASAMAQASFGNPRVYVEKFLTNVRHIEIQVVADKYGNVFAFDERDCSVQRNNQKLIEITPSPWAGMTDSLRETLKDYATALVRAVGYYSLCTVEFLVTEAGQPYLIEVNTRLQVEHGITECRYGIDLVEEQVAVAMGARLRITEGNTRPVNHAMQVRINCEDPLKDFAPNSGLITRYISPGGPGVRLDSNLTAGYEFPSNYDSAGALLIAYGQDWAKIRGIMERALSEYTIGGIKTTIPFHRQVINHPKFKAGDFDTRFIAKSAELTRYLDLGPEAERLGRLVAEISARGYNPFVQLGEYRTACTPRMPRFNPSLPVIAPEARRAASPYPRGDRKALLDHVRDSGIVHFTDTTCRDCTQSNSGNRFRLAEDALVGPYLDNAGFFSLEVGGGAHFHVAMMTNMTNPLTEAREWNKFAPKTMKQILVRSTNVLGYKPQPQNLMRRMAEAICGEYHVVRCFDFLNHIDNMKPFAEVVLDNRGCVFEPALSLSRAPGFTVKHYLETTAEIVRMAGKVTGLGSREAAREIILGLKDMAGVCSPRFIAELVAAIRKRWPDLVLHYHRHFTDGLFVPAVTAAVKAGAHIVDTSLGAATRWYGQGEVLSTAALIEEELGMGNCLNKAMIRDGNFVLKQIAPYYDRYAAPYFQGVDYDVVSHGMPGGATSSSQEGALKQGHISLLPHILQFLPGIRAIVRYHDVTPGSQITWNTAFLAVTEAHKRGGELEVAHLLSILSEVAAKSEEEIPESMKTERLIVYRDCNDAFKDLLLGKFGKLPLGFPPDWVYRSAFGDAWEKAIAGRTEESPLKFLEATDFAAERKALETYAHREVTEDEFLMYLNHPADALKTMEFRQQYGDPNHLPVDVWFEGLKEGDDLHFTDGAGKPHHFQMLQIGPQDANGVCVVRYLLDSDFMSDPIQVGNPGEKRTKQYPLADPGNPWHLGAPSNGDLWVVYVHPGDVVKKGEELFNVSIMKQEKAILAPMDAVVKRVLKTADYKNRKKMVPVSKGELIIELAPASISCVNARCGKPLEQKGFVFCPHCGSEQPRAK